MAVVNQSIEMSLKVIAIACIFAVATAMKPYQGYNMPLFDSRVVGGEDALPGEFPYLVSLQWGWLGLSHFCGGSILNDRWIITAGHCARAIPDYGDFYVKAGKFNLKEKESSEQSVLVEKTIVHAQYDGSVGPYDIALVKLTKPLQFNAKVQPIKLSKAGSTPSGESILAGWGSTSKTNNPIMPDKLQTVKLPIVDLKTCKTAIEKLTGPAPLHQCNVCTGPLVGGFSACNGDSGGPLISKANGQAELIGIVSWGIVPCGTIGAPSVYTKASYFNDWIEEQMAKN